MNRNLTRSSKLLCSLLALAWLASCGSDDEDTNTPPQALKSAPAYGPAGTPLPEGFTQFSWEQVRALGNDGNFSFITAADAEEARSAATQQGLDDEALVAAAAARDPALAALLQQPEEAANVKPTGGGDWQLTLDPANAASSTVIVNGRAPLVQDLAAGLREGASRSQREQVYLDLLGALPEDQRLDLPVAAAVGGLAAADLEVAIATLVERANTVLDAEGLPFDIDPPGESFSAVSQFSGLPSLIPSGCLAQGPLGLMAKHSWPLKTALTPVRHQGKRGTCSAFAIAGAMETAIRRNYGRASDLSEQWLYGTARAEWQPPAANLAEERTEGLPLASTMRRMRDSAFEVFAEKAWPYNPSWNRIVSLPGPGFTGTFTDSCRGYPHTCTDTTHQQVPLCATYADPMSSGTLACGYWNQVDDDSTIRNFIIGISMTNGGTLSVRGSTIRDNTTLGINLPAVEALPYRSAVYNLTLRNSTIAGNGSGAAGQGGIRMVGAATAVFDLGTAADPGGNLLAGSDAQGPALRVDVQPGVTVSAVGNQWLPLTQGADASGRYTGTVLPTAGSGANYVITSGALRLAGTP